MLMGACGGELSTTAGRSWRKGADVSYCPYPLVKSESVAATAVRSVATDMLHPTDPTGMAAGPRSFTARAFTTYARAAESVAVAQRVTTANISFTGLPHGAVATCSEHSCYCADFGDEYGYKDVPWGRYPADALHLYSAVTLKSGHLLATAVVCEKGSTRNSLAVFRSTDNSTHEQFEFLSFAVRGSFWTFPNVTSATSEHDATVLSDGTVLVVLRLGGDGQCSNPIGVYKPFYRVYSTTEGKTWSTPTAIENSGCAWPQVVTLGSGLTVMAGGRLCSENMCKSSAHPRILLPPRVFPC
jgi:hypothetical protein